MLWVRSSIEATLSRSRFVWHDLRRVNKIPGAYGVYSAIMKLYLRDGKIVYLRRGPGTGLLWRHFQCYQPWMALGTYEPDVADLIFARLRAGQVFYDVGANAGYFSLIAARKVGDSGRVVAFDPVPRNVDTIREQVLLNEFEQICEIEQVAIAAFEGVTDLNIPERNANAHIASIAAPHVPHMNGESVQVRCITLDSYVQTRTIPDLIKVDIEGAEVEALKGAARLLADKQAPEWLITAHSDELASQVVEILQSNSYRISDFPHMIHGIPPAKQ